MSVRVDNGKYEFSKDDLRIHILRHGQPWHSQADAYNAIASLMAELDAARVVLEAVRKASEDGWNLSTSAYVRGEILDALKTHDALVDDQEKPSEWTR